MLNELFRNRERLFWLLNSLGWGGYTGAAYLGALAHEKPDTFVAVSVAAGALGFVFSIPMRYAYGRLWKQKPWQIASGVVLISYVTAAVWRWIHNVLYFEWVKRGWQPEHTLDYIDGVMGSFYIMLCWSGLYFGIKYYQELQQQTEQTLKATAAAHQAQLMALRYQLNPHFLFNTLNAISTLILDRENATANLSVTRLSDFLRYSLDNDPMKRVSLRQELEALDLYLEIEKVRFGERLHVEREIETLALDGLVPSLILQPLIENAVKYAVTPREEGGHIMIAAKVHQGSLMITVADDGPGLGNGSSQHKSSGVGLKNTRERLKQLYGEQQALTLAPNAPRGLVITINLPFETREDESGRG